MQSTGSSNDALTGCVFPDPKPRRWFDPSSRKGRLDAYVEVGVIVKSRSEKVAPKILIADDDPCVLRAVADRCARMGFNVETATNGLQVLIKASQHKRDILVIDVHMPEVDGLSVLSYLSEAANKTSHVMVVTGHPGQEIVERCKGLDASCIHKGLNFWNEFETTLAGIYPQMEFAIRQSGRRSAKIEVKKSPRILLVDDDVCVKKLFFSRFENLGAELLYAVDGVRGFWVARREEPTVIVSDYHMPNGDAECLLVRLRSVPETGSIPVIVQTGRRLNDLIKQRLRRPICGFQGATRILRKSSDGGELFEALQRLCGFASGLDGELLYK
jgi:CheY-like chemotaxis protein